MKLNDNILTILKEYRIAQEDGICYLVSLYYGFSPSYIPNSLRQKVNSSGIVVQSEKGGLEWRVPLFEQQATNFDWVLTEYLSLFKPFAKNNKFKRECVTRMKALFSQYPDIRKEEILSATELYIKQCIRERRSPKYVSNPHFFIEKGKGVEKVNQLLTYIDLHREKSQEFSGGRTSQSTIMQ